MILKINPQLKKDRKTVAVVLARGGSKRLPKKNIKNFAGKPLIVHSIEYANSYQQISEVYVSTDDPEIKKISLECGVKVIDRPEELATDLSASVDALCHFVNQFPNEEFNVVCLQPTNPIRLNDLFGQAFDKYLSSDCASLFSVNHSDLKLGKIDENGFYLPYNYYFGQRSQDIEQLYYENGNIYIISSELLRHNKICATNTSVFIEYLETVDIDTLDDFHKAEKVWYKAFNKKYNYKYLFVISSKCCYENAILNIAELNLSINDVIFCICKQSINEDIEIDSKYDIIEVDKRVRDLLYSQERDITNLCDAYLNLLFPNSINYTSYIKRTNPLYKYLYQDERCKQINILD